MRRSTMRGCLLIISAILMAIVLILVIGVWIWFARSAKLVDEEFAKIREAGEPVSAEDMDAFYQTPEKSKDCTDLWLNATAMFDGDEYDAACGELPIVGQGEAEIPPPGDPWPDQAAAEALLKAEMGRKWGRAGISD